MRNQANKDARVAIAPSPQIGRSVNPIWTRVAEYAHHEKIRAEIV